MLGVTGGIGFAAGGKSGPVITFRDVGQTGGNANSYTKASCEIGPDVPGRVVIVIAACARPQNVTACTVGGVSAVAVTGSSSVRIFKAINVVGTVVSVTVNFSATSEMGRLTVFSMEGAKSDQAVQQGLAGTHPMVAPFTNVKGNEAGLLAGQTNIATTVSAVSLCTKINEGTGDGPSTNAVAQFGADTTTPAIPGATFNPSITWASASGTENLAFAMWE